MGWIFFSKILFKETIVHLHSDYLKTEYKNLNYFKKKIFYLTISLFDKGIVLSESLRDNLVPFIKEKNIFEVYNFFENE